MKLWEQVVSLLLSQKVRTGVGVGVGVGVGFGAEDLELALGAVGTLSGKAVWDDDLEEWKLP